MAFLLFNHKIKYLFYTIVVAGLILFIVFQEDVLYTYVASIFSSSASADVKGSSVEMRLRQLLGCFDIISSNPLFGNGFGWTAYYNQMNGDHPVVLAFESYIFVALCNWGLVGFAFGFCFCGKYIENVSFWQRKKIDEYYLLLSMSYRLCWIYLYYRRLCLYNVLVFFLFFNVFRYVL